MSTTSPASRRMRHIVPRLSTFAVEHLLLLPIGAAIALVWANTLPESYFRTSYAIGFAVNDIAMMFFFALLTKEVVEATVAGGVLHPWRRAALPMIAAPALMLVPSFFLIAFVRGAGVAMLEQAWLVPAAIDLAVGYFILRLAFKAGHPVIPFFLLLGIATDVLVLLLLPIVYADSRAFGFEAVLLFALALGAAYGLRRARVRSFWPYVLAGGGLSWAALYFGGLQTALALIPIVPFLPHARRDPGFFVDASPHAHDALNRFELWARYPAQAALLLFGLVNGGVPLRALEIGTWAVPFANLAGKPVGLLIGITIATAAGFHLPHRIGWRELTVTALVTTSGFSVALFVAQLAMGPGQLLSETRMGVLVSLAGVPLALIAARLLRVGRFASHRHEEPPGLLEGALKARPH